jgi:nitroimidazol reductase NimA-like FMN-containing flavoprotein (pyridoxamine 5'-phosphate oxidase superfamily)
MPGYGIAAAEEGKGLLPWSWAEGFIAAARNYPIVTNRAGGGAPHAMPVWGVWIDGRLWFSTSPTSTKARNIKRDPRVTVPLAHEHDEEAVVLEGVAEQLPADVDRTQFNAAYKEKYDWDMAGDWALWAIRPTRVFAFSAGGDFAGTTTRWQFDARP